jgi:hypothetical protein
MGGSNMTVNPVKKVSIIPGCFLLVMSLSIALLLSSSAVAYEYEGGIQYTIEPITKAITIASSMASEQKEGSVTGNTTIAGKSNAMKDNMDKRGKGRNISKNTWGIGIQHIYSKINTELTKRQLLTSDGAATTLTEIPITADIVNGFPTTSHIDQLYLRFGLSESLEIFGGIGGSYNDSISDAKPSYGVGLRLNLFQTGGDSINGFYGAVQEEYIVVDECKEEYRGVTGERWGKSADFKSLNSKIELGITRSNLNIYVGGSFLTYKEDTERNLLDNMPAGLVSAMYQDELEEEDVFGVFGGLSYYLTPSILLNVEGQYGNRNSVSAAVEYRF